MINEEEAYAEFLADIILSYFASQLQAGRSVLYENEIWELLGQPFPEGRENRSFKLKEYKDNIIDFSKYKNKLN